MSRADVRDRDGLRDVWSLTLTSPKARWAAIVVLLFSVLLLASACGSAAPDATGSPDGDGEQVEAVEPEDVLSEEERTGAPEYSEWNDPAAEDYEPGTRELFVGSDSSTGAIPAVKPFNFGRDPGGPEDKTLSLTVPEIGLEDVPVFDSLSEESLEEGTVHVPATGFPWQKGANTYIAGHRVGYPDTPSDEIFYDLPDLKKGDEITVEDADGGEYVYRVSMKKVVGPRDVEVMNPPEDGSVVTLQTCTLPDYEDRIIVQGELVEKES
jgi:sortase A